MNGADSVNRFCYDGESGKLAMPGNTMLPGSGTGTKAIVTPPSAVAIASVTFRQIKGDSTGISEPAYKKMV